MDRTKPFLRRPLLYHWRTILDTLTTIAMLVAAVTIITARFVPAGIPARRSPVLPTAPVALDDAATLGSRTASVGVLVFSDFQCPFCSKFARETMGLIDENYVKRGSVLFAFRHLPLPIHARAWKAAEAAECARGQGAFWRMHDRMFEEPSNLEVTELFRLARALGLDRETFDSCMSGQATVRIKKDVAEAKRMGIEATPFFLIGTVEAGRLLKPRQAISGARTFAEFSLSDRPHPQLRSRQKPLVAFRWPALLIRYA